MTPNRRIVLNFIATYGRSLYATFCGLFTARWVLMALGEADYGLIGMVGGIIGFVSFFNSLLATSVSRFYAYSVGESAVEGEGVNAHEKIRRWFNVALMLHLIVATFSITVGYPIGVWAIENFLRIPPHRVIDSIWVFRISCLSCFVSMISVPFIAMYTAKQEIAELTIYGFIKTTLNVIAVYYMMSHNSDWFVSYAGWMAFLVIVPLMVITIRALIKYHECRIVPRYFFLRYETKELLRYAGLRSLSSFSTMLTFNGTVILVNRMLGPVRNAAVTLSNRVSSHVLSLTASLNAALSPAITNAAGARDYKRLQALSSGADMFATLCVAIFAIPLLLEMDTVLKLWLTKVPEGTATLCRLMLLAKMIDQMTVGEYLSLVAYRDIAKFQLFDCIMYLVPFVVAALVFSLGGDIWGLGVGFLLMYFIDNIGKLYFARKICKFAIRRWFAKFFLPVLIVVGTSVSIASISATCFNAGWLRVVLTSLLTDAFLVVVAWRVLLPKEIKNLIQQKMFSKLNLACLAHKN